VVIVGKSRKLDEIRQIASGRRLSVPGVDEGDLWESLQIKNLIVSKGRISR
jgi:hypothetical protein